MSYIGNVVNVISANLSEDLDVSGQDIISSSNGNIEILPDGSGKVHIDGNGSTGGVVVSDGLIEIKTGTGNVAELRLYCENTSSPHYLALKAPTHGSGWSGNYSLTLPTTDGDSGQYLKTDGSGVLSWDTPSTGGNAFTTIAVSGQSDVVADSATDTLTLVAGSNITLTTNASGDSVTIASSGGGGGSTGDISFSSSDISTNAGTMNFKIDADNDDSGYDGYYFYGGPTSSGYARFWIADNQNETGLQMYVDGTYRSIFKQTDSKFSMTFIEGGENHPTDFYTNANGSSGHINLGTRHSDAKVRIVDSWTGSLFYALPRATPNNGDVLTASDASGTLAWSAPSGGGGGGFSQDSNNNLVAGTDAGDALTSNSQYNICIGQDAGKQLQSSGDDYNIMIGYKCGVRMQGGDDTKPNVFIGSDIAPTWTNGWKNTIFIGDEVAKYHVSPFSVYGDSTADHSDIAIGNTHLGNYSGRNIAIGNNTMRAHYSEDSIQIGHQSSDIQSQHLDRSILIGGDIMTNQHGGHANKAMCGNIVAIGYNAYLNGGAGTSDSDANVTCVGTQAGNNLTSGTNVTCIGYDSEASSATATNEVTLGDSSVATLRCNTQTISSLSDERDKKDIEDIDIGLDFINDLRPVNFTWDRRDGSMHEIKSQGFIAQEVDEVQQKYNCEDYLQAVMKENPEKLEMSYGKLVPALVKAIQELTDRVEELEIGLR